MHSLRRNFGYQMAYRILTIITPLITTPVLSRALGAEALGVYSATQAYVNYFVLFAMLGVEKYGNRSIAALQGDRKAIQACFWNIYAVQFFASCISMTVYLLSSIWVPVERRIFMLMQSLWLVSCLLDINWFYFGCEQFRLTVTRSTIIKLLTVVCIVLFIHSPADLAKYILIMAGGTVVSQMVLWSALPGYISFEWPRWQLVRTHVRPMLYLFVPVLAASVFHIMDKTMLDLLSNEENLGYYYSADKMINIPLGVISAVSTVMLPRMSNIIETKTPDDARRMLKKSSELITFLIAAIGFGIAAVAQEFVPLFFGPGFEPCVHLVYCFVPVLFVKSWGDMICSQYLIPAKQDRLYTAAVFAGAAANLVANYVLIRRYAAVGAVLGTFLAESVVLIIEMVGTRNEVSFLRLIRSQFKYILFGGAMLIVVRVFASSVHFNILLQLGLMILLGAFIFTFICCTDWLIEKKGIFYDMLLNITEKIKTRGV